MTFNGIQATHIFAYVYHCGTCERKTVENAAEQQQLKGTSSFRQEQIPLSPLN